MANFTYQQAAFNRRMQNLRSGASTFSTSPGRSNRPNRATRKNSNFSRNFSGPSSLNPAFNGSRPNAASWSASRNRSNNMTSFSAHSSIAERAQRCQAQMKSCMAARGGSRRRKRNKKF